MTLSELCEAVRIKLKQSEIEAKRESDEMYERMREIARENAAQMQERRDQELRTLAHYIALEMKKGN